MVIEVRCPKCGNLWKYKGKACLATCTSCYHKVPVRSLPDPAPGPKKTPPAVRKLLEKKTLEKIPEGQLISGETQEQASGRKIRTQTIVAPAPIIPRVRPLQAREVVGNCRYCQKPLRENPQLNVMLNEHDRYHSICILTKIIMESSGDLATAAADYGVPLEALQKRAMRLLELGKQLPEGVLV